MRSSFHSALFQQSPVPMQVYELRDPDDDDSLTLVGSNQAAYDSTGFDYSDRIGMTLKKAFPRAAHMVPVAVRCIREQVEIDMGDIEYGDQEIEWQVFSVKLSPVDDKTAVATYQNVTALRNLENAVANYLKANPGEAVGKLKKALHETRRPEAPEAPVFWAYSAFLLVVLALVVTVLVTLMS